MPQSTRRKGLGEFWETDLPQAREALPEFTRYLESSAHIYLKLSLRTGPSSSPLFPRQARP